MFDVSSTCEHHAGPHLINVPQGNGVAPRVPREIAPDRLLAVPAAHLSQVRNEAQL